MTNLETMEKATSFTTGAYMSAYYKNVENGSLTYSQLEQQAIAYSAQALYKTINDPSGKCRDYTRQFEI